MTSSGAVSISTSDGGTAGVSGNIGLTTGDTANGNTGTIAFTSGKSTGGKGGSITLSVGEGNTGIGGDVTVNAGITSASIMQILQLQVVKVQQHQVVVSIINDGGTAGVSGNIGLTTGDTADGNTGTSH